MSYEPMNRRLATLAAVFAFVGVLIGVIALATNYWSYNSTLMLNDDGTYITQGRTDNDTWNGLFKRCHHDSSCVAEFWSTTFILCLLGLVFLLAGGIFSALDVPKASDRRFITPLLIFVACVLLTAGLFDYAASKLLNYHSSRAMIAALVLAYTALPIAAFVAGRYSALERSVLINNEGHHGTQKYSATGSNGL